MGDDTGIWLFALVAAVGIVTGWAIGALATANIDQPLTSVERMVIVCATALAFVLTVRRLGADPALPAFLVLTAALVLQTTIDLKVHRLPRQISYIATAISLIIMIVVALVEGDSWPLIRAIIGGFVATGVLGLMYVASRGSLGDGDVRMAPLLGLHLGYLGIAHVVLGIFLATIYGAVVGIAALAGGFMGMKGELAYGPFLAAGTLTAVWWGTALLALWS